MKSIVYIASLGHSGSTLLELMLGGDARFIGLGEVARFLEQGVEKAQQATCSCGNQMHNCVFWSNVASRLTSSDNLKLEEQYKLVLDTFEEVFGQDAIPIDSSKYIPYLDILNTRLQLDVKVLYVIRDVRSFTISYLDNIRRKEKAGGRNVIQRMSAYIFWQWYLKNKELQRFLINHNLRVFQVGYEELCLYPGFMLQKIGDFLGAELEPFSRKLNKSMSHVMRGNRMRYQQEKSEIFYDHRWFLRREWLIPAFLFPNIITYNAQEVYGNHTEAIWKQ